MAVGWNEHLSLNALTNGFKKTNKQTKKDRKCKVRVSGVPTKLETYCLTEYNELLSAAPLFSHFKWLWQIESV